MVAADTRALPARLQGLLGPLVRGAGLELEDVEVSAAGRRRVLRVVVDRDGGVDLDGVAELSRAVSVALDGSNLMGGQPYVLEISSPGTDRPLTQPRHWRRAVGRLVRVEACGGGVHTARVLDADDDVVHLADMSEPLRYADIRRARVQVEFGSPTGAEGSGVADTNTED